MSWTQSVAACRYRSTTSEPMYYICRYIYTSRIYVTCVITSPCGIYIGLKHLNLLPYIVAAKLAAQEQNAVSYFPSFAS